MLASENLIKAFNEQIGNELAASNLYLSIASYFSSQTLNELSRFFHRQSEEERQHAMKFVTFVVDAEGGVEIPEIPAPRSSFEDAADAVRLALDSEERVTRQIYSLVDVAREDSNYIAQSFLEWFVDEQFEEINSMSSLLQVVERAGQDGLMMVEEYLVREGLPSARG